MGDWPFWDGGRRVMEVHEVELTPGTPNSNQKGAWTQLAASLTADLDWLLVTVQNSYSAMVDLGMGAAGAEVVMLPDLWALGISGVMPALFPVYVFPVSWPVGTRMAARAAAEAGNPTVSVFGVSGGFSGFPPFSGGLIQTLGAVTSASGGGGTSLRFGSAPAWTELIAATSAPIRYLVMQMRRHPSQVVTVTGYPEIAVGAAGAEQLVFRGPRAKFQLGDASIYGPPPTVGPVPLSIPSGSRVAARLISTTVDETSSRPRLLLYGGR